MRDDRSNQTKPLLVDQMGASKKNEWNLGYYFTHTHFSDCIIPQKKNIKRVDPLLRLGPNAVTDFDLVIYEFWNLWLQFCVGQKLVSPQRLQTNRIEIEIAHKFSC